MSAHNEFDDSEIKRRLGESFVPFKMTPEKYILDPGLACAVLLYPEGSGHSRMNEVLPTHLHRLARIGYKVEVVSDVRRTSSLPEDWGGQKITFIHNFGAIIEGCVWAATDPGVDQIFLTGNEKIVNIIGQAFIDEPMTPINEIPRRAALPKSREFTWVRTHTGEEDLSFNLPGFIFALESLRGQFDVAIYPPSWTLSLTTPRQAFGIIHGNTFLRANTYVPHENFYELIGPHDMSARLTPFLEKKLGGTLMPVHG